MRFRDILKEASKPIRKERNDAIIKNHNKGLDEKDIAKLLDVHYSTVHNVIRAYRDKK